MKKIVVRKTEAVKLTSRVSPLYGTINACRPVILA
jgi:hypothetical protein